MFSFAMSSLSISNDDVSSIHDRKTSNKHDIAVNGSENESSLHEVTSMALNILQKYEIENEKVFETPISKNDVDIKCAAIMEAFHSLQDVGEKVASAWDSGISQQTDMKNNSFDEVKFRETYMEIVTDSFGDELDAMRKGEGRKGADDIANDNIHFVKDGAKETIDFEVLVDCLESGMDTFTQEEKNLKLSRKMGDFMPYLKDAKYSLAVSDKKDLTFEYERKLDEDGSLTASFKMNDYAEVAWKDNGWVASAKSKLDGMTPLEPDVRIKRDVSF